MDLGKFSSADAFRPDFLEGAKDVKTSLQRLRREIENQNPPKQEGTEQKPEVSEELSPLSLDQSFNALKSALEKAKGNPALEALLAEEMAAIAQTDFVPALILALSENKADSQETLLRGELTVLNDEIDGVSDYLKSFPPPSIFDRITDFFQKLDPTVREFLLNFLEGFSFAGIITGPVRWRKAVEEALESDDIKNNEEYKKKLNDPLEFAKIKKEWTTRYTGWQAAKATMEKAKKENKSFIEPKYGMPTVLEVLTTPKDPRLEQKPPEMVSNAPQAPGATPPAAPASANPPATNPPKPA